MHTVRIDILSLALRCTLACCVALSVHSAVFAQTLSEKWSVAIPKDMTSLTINMQGTRYAYLIGNGKSLVRGNALTGVVLDTVAVPDALQVEYAYDVVYCFYKDTANVYRFLYLADESDTLGIVPLMVLEKQTSISASLYSRTSTPTLRMLGRLRAMEVDVYREDIDYHQFLSTYSHAYRVIRDSLLPGIHQTGNVATVASADGSQLLRVDDEFRSHRIGGGPDFSEYITRFSEYYVDSASCNHRLTLSEPFTRLFLPMQCSGILGIAIQSGEVRDHGRGVVLYADTNLNRCVGNLWSGGYQLVTEPLTNRLQCYNIATREQSLVLQSDTNRPVGSMAFYSRQSSSTLFAINPKRDELIAYHIATPPPNERVELTRDHDTIRAAGVVRCNATLYAEAAGCTYQWYVDDSLWSTTNKPEVQLSFPIAGVYMMHIVVMRDSVFVASDSIDRALVVQQVGGFDFSTRVSQGPVLDIAVNDNGTHLGCSLQDTVALLHTSFNKRQITPVLRIPYMGGIGFLSNDSVITSSSYRRYGDDYRITTSFAVRSLFGDSIASLPNRDVPRSYHQDYVDGELRTLSDPTALSSALLINKNTNRYYWFTRFSPNWPLNPERGHLMRLDKEGTASFWQREFREPCKAVSTPNGTCMTFGKKVFLVDLPAYTITDSIVAPKGWSFTAAVLANSDIILTNLGLYRRDTEWQLTTPHKFSGTTGLLLMSNPNYYIAVVQTLNASAHVVSRVTGEIVHTFPSAFHYSTAAAYDSVYRMLYIGDSTGYITAWNVPSEFAVSVEGQPRTTDAQELLVSPNPARTTVQISVPQNVSIVSCSAVSPLGTTQPLDVALIQNTCCDAVLDIASLAPGMYVLVVNTTQGTMSANLIVMRP